MADQGGLLGGGDTRELLKFVKKRSKKKGMEEQDPVSSGQR